MRQFFLMVIAFVALIGTAHGATTDFKTLSDGTFHVPLYDPSVGDVFNPNAYGRYELSDVLRKHAKSIETISELEGIDTSDGITTVYLIERGGGYFIWNNSNLSTQVSSDTAQGVYIAPNSDPTGASGAWVRKISGNINVLWFGADNTNSSDSAGAINAAIAFMPNPSILEFPHGSYRVDSEILIPYAGVNGSGKHLHFDDCQILAGTNNINIIHWSDSVGIITGKVKLSGNGHTGVTCFRLTPELEASNTTVVNQNHNRFLCQFELTSATEGIVLMAGVPISGTASGCWYNIFLSVYATSIDRAVWFKDNGSVDAVSSGSNSNIFYSFVANGSVNTGIQIAAGGGNTFYSPQFENITNGTSPNATPTALLISNAMANGGDNPNNMFFSPHWENCTLHSTINEPITQMILSDMDFALSNGSATLQTYIPSGNNSSQQYILAGIRSQAIVEKIRVDGDGILMIGVTDKQNAAASEIVLGNVKYINGTNAASNSAFKIGGVNSSDQVEIGDADANLVMSSAQWGTESPSVISVGAADSGGTGYRLLRIPNAP